MVIGKFYNGSGLGNMLHRYVATRVLALDKGFDYGMVYLDDGAGKEQGFKGKFFIEQPKLVDYPIEYKEWHEKKITENGVDIRGYDPEFNFIEDNTLIEGEFQDSRYFSHRLKEVDEWLKVEPIDISDDTCVIGFRGGEFAIYPDLFLNRIYWLDAIKHIRTINPNMRFEVQTDDVLLARAFFPDFKVIHDIGYNWRAIRYAKYLILSNSSFGILPSILNKNVELVIAPKYFARHNVSDGYWALEQNLYKKFTYLDREGKLSSYDTCKKELEEYNEKRGRNKMY